MNIQFIRIETLDGPTWLDPTLIVSVIPWGNSSQVTYGHGTVFEIFNSLKSPDELMQEIMRGVEAIVNET